jgi:hypothetical protein
MTPETNLRQMHNHSAKLAEELEHIKTASQSLNEGNNVLENQLKDILDAFSQKFFLSFLICFLLIQHL